MGSFHGAHKIAGVPAHHPLDYLVHPSQGDDGSRFFIVEVLCV
jgi:hypothetical protein